MGVFFPCYKITWGKKIINQRVAALKSTDTDKGKLKIHSTHLKETYQCESFMKKAGHDFIYMKTYYFMLKVIGYKNIITNVTNLLQILQRWQNRTGYSNNFVI